MEQKRVFKWHAHGNSAQIKKVGKEDDMNGTCEIRAETWILAVIGADALMVALDAQHGTPMDCQCLKEAMRVGVI